MEFSSWQTLGKNAILLIFSGKMKIYFKENFLKNLAIGMDFKCHSFDIVAQILKYILMRGRI